MNTLHPMLQNPHPYQGEIEVAFEENDSGALELHIDTEDLHGEYVKEKDVEQYVGLFSDSAVMEKYADGKPRERGGVENRVRNAWIKRWQEEKNPYTGIAFSKSDTDDFVVHVVAGGGDEPGQSELAYLARKKLWGKGYTKQAVTAVVHEYLPQTIKKNYKMNGEKLREIVLTARPDNPASVRIAVDIGMKKYKEEEKFGAVRWHFNLQAENLRGMT